MLNKKSAILLGLAVELVVLELILISAGAWVDKQWSWSGFGVIGGAIIGFGGWVFHLLVALKMSVDE